MTEQEIKAAKQQISVVIQGPLDDRTYEAIDAYQDFGEVIVSTWSSGEDYRHLCSVAPESKFKLTTSLYPRNMNNVHNFGGVFYISQTLFSGSLVAEKPYILKTRTDELYPNLDKFIENFVEHPTRFHTTDNGFWKHHPYCLSNHLFLDSTENTRRATDSLLRYCRKQDFQQLGQMHCEQLFGIFFMAVRTDEFDTKDWKKFFQEYVWITPCEDLPGHLHSGQSSVGRGFKRSKNYPCGRKEVSGGCHDPNGLYSHVKDIK